jgi:hypothetical protein
MSLEAGTFINDLVTSNPPGSDPILQGDDHLRLIKSVLKSTFPNADKAFYLPDALAKTADYTVLAADINKFITGDATTGVVNLTLPTLVAANDGWVATFQKIDASANAVTIVGTINGAANLSLTARYDAAIVWWSGTAWFAIAIPKSLAVLASNNTFTGDNTFTNLVNLTEDIRFSGSITPSITADQTDWAPAGHATVSAILLSTDATERTINSLDGVADGRIIFLGNTNNSTSFVLLHDDGATGTASMRFLCPNAANLRIRGGGGVILRYQAGSVNRWRPLMVMDAASQATMEAAASPVSYVNPLNQHFHPGHVKFWGYVTVSGGTPTLQTSYNVTSITDTAAGRLTVTIGTDFSSANWSCHVSADLNNTDGATSYSNIAAGSFIIENVTSGAGLDDADSYSFMGLGDQA